MATLARAIIIIACSWEWTDLSAKLSNGCATLAIYRMKLCS